MARRASLQQVSTLASVALGSSIRYAQGRLKKDRAAVCSCYRSGASKNLTEQGKAQAFQPIPTASHSHSSFENVVPSPLCWRCRLPSICHQVGPPWLKALAHGLGNSRPQLVDGQGKNSQGDRGRDKEESESERGLDSLSSAYSEGPICCGHVGLAARKVNGEAEHKQLPASEARYHPLGYDPLAVVSSARSYSPGISATTLRSKCWGWDNLRSKLLSLAWVSLGEETAVLDITDSQSPCALCARTPPRWAPGSQESRI